MRRLAEMVEEFAMLDPAMTTLLNVDKASQTCSTGSGESKPT